MRGTRYAGCTGRAYLIHTHIESRMWEFAAIAWANECDVALWDGASPGGMRRSRRARSRCIGDSSSVSSSGRRASLWWRCRRECDLGAVVAAAVDFGREGSDSVAATSRAKSTSQTRKGRPRRRIAGATCYMYFRAVSDMRWHNCIHKHSHVMILYTHMITRSTTHNKGSHVLIAARV
jgi:hypothetical protein